MKLIHHPSFIKVTGGWLDQSMHLCPRSKINLEINWIVHNVISRIWWNEELSLFYLYYHCGGSWSLLLTVGFLLNVIDDCNKENGRLRHGSLILSTFPLYIFLFNGLYLLLGEEKPNLFDECIWILLSGFIVMAKGLGI